MKKNIICFVAGAIIGIVSTLGVQVVAEIINEERCYNLPLGLFFKDDNCRKYWEGR